MYRLTTFGGLSLADSNASGAPVLIQRRRLALLAVLASQGQRGVSRDRLLLLLWPETDEARGRNNLKQALHALRRDLGPALLVAGSHDLFINPAIVTCDRGDFEAALADGDLARAANLWAGPFLDGFHPGGMSEEFERWLDDERARLSLAYRETLSVLAARADEAGDPAAAVHWWRRLVASDPLNGRAALGLVRALAASGDPAGAMAQARAHQEMRRAELDAAPDPAIAAVVDEIRARPAPLPSPMQRPTRPPSLIEPPATERSEPAVAAGRPVQPRRRGLRTVSALLLVALAALAVTTTLTGPSRAASAFDARVIAVAPFQIADTGLQLWREGMPDYLARNLDGAGGFRTVPPSVVLRHWSGRADAISAQELGRRTGAGFVVFGGLMGAGGDSVRLSASVFDVRRGRVVGMIELRNSNDHFDRLIDSLTLAVLTEVGRDRPALTGHFVSFGSSSLPAIRVFLRAEQFFRQGQWDSAETEYERAIARDTTFGLAYDRLGQTLSWIADGRDHTALATLSADRARRFGHGLAPHDSLLLTADGLWGGLSAEDDSIDYPRQRQLLGAYEELARRYPADPEAWYRLGEGRYHLSSGLGGTAEQALAAFDESVRRDSTYVAGYEHLVKLALAVGGISEARKRAEQAMAVTPDSSAYRLFLAVIADPPVASPALNRAMHAASRADLIMVYRHLSAWADSAETSVRLAAEAAGRPSEPGYPEGRLPQDYAALLAYRGHIAAATRALMGPPPALTSRTRKLAVQLGLLGAMASESVDSIGRLSLADGDPLGLMPMLPWWAQQRDSASLRLARRVFQRVGRARGVSPAAARIAEYGDQAAAAYLTLASGDSAAATVRFAALPDSLCAMQCLWHRLTAARLLSAHGRAAQSVALLRTDRLAQLDRMPAPVDVLVRLQLAQSEEQGGERSAAAADYRFVVSAWRRADPSLLPYVADARTALARLSAK